MLQTFHGVLAASAAPELSLCQKVFDVVRSFVLGECHV